MSKEYGLKFGTSDLTQYVGLSPTFTTFVRMDTGATVAPPGITQIFSSLAVYKFNYTPSFPIYFQVDGATTGLGADRYIVGTLDPIQSDNERLDNMGATVSAIAVTLVGIGTTLNSNGALLVGLGSTQSLISTQITGLGTTLVAQGSTVVGIGTTLAGVGVTQTYLGTQILGIGSSLGVIGTSQAAIGSTISGIAATLSGIGVTVSGIGVTLPALGALITAEGVTVSAMAALISAIGTSMSGSNATILSFALALGTSASSFGTVTTDPIDVMGALKRLQELYEGRATFTKQGAVWTAYDRTGGVTIMVKTLNSGALTTTKT